MTTREDDSYSVLTPNQLVAQNLYLARTLRGWTQEEAAENLEPFIGKRWSKASWSAAERSAAGERVREFTADEIYAFSKCFQLPLTYFLMPPAHDVHGRIPAIQLPGPAVDNKADSPAVWLEHLFEINDDIFDRLAGLFSKVIPPEAQTITQRRLADRYSRYVVSTMAQEFEDLDRWEHDLRSLADRVAHVREAALTGAMADKEGLLQTTEVE